MNFFNRMGTRDISLLGIALYYVMLECMGKFTIRQMNRTAQQNAYCRTSSAHSFGQK
ncbi:hypothetical protein [Pectinatus frisingensis]|uniref:hypothetical protein n=1 Tax=Pectinatus frisingensis TaxID=865 RepID=UPI001E34CB60|nr:hypothetical protein [Pectinatus frisingensis]